MTNQNEQKTLEWRLNVIMSERRIKTVTDLKRRLDAIGFSISSAQLGRVVWERPQKINIDLLEGLLTVLACDISDILKVVTVSQPGIEKETKAPKQADQPVEEKKEPRPRVKPVLTLTSKDITGPKLTAIPLPERLK
ncbi:MAG: helix-turn-helix transcriptional regulator [Desulfuromonadaceae bacterium]|nr:helix-turn-helix transcriptional regulator [Desulfuromonadaceae bacterium]